MEHPRRIVTNYFGPIISKYGIAYDAVVGYSMFGKFWKQTYLSSMYNNTICNTICAQLSCVQERNNMYTDTYAQIYINYTSNNDAYVDFDRFYCMTYEQLDEIINNEKDEHYKYYLLKLKEYKQYMDCTNDKDELKNIIPHYEAFDLQDIYGLRERFTITIGQCVLGTHMISQDGEFRVVSSAYKALKASIAANERIYNALRDKLIPRFKDTIKVRVTQNDVGLADDKVQLINKFILDTDIWLELYILTWLINVNKYIKGDTEDNFNKIFFMSFMINKDVEINIYKSAITTAGSQEELSKFKSNIRAYKNVFTTISAGQKMTPLTIKEAICLLTGRYEYIQGSAIRELTLLKRLEVLVYNKIIFHVPFIYDWFVLCNMRNPIVNSELQAKKNKLSDSLKAINDVLQSVDRTADKEKVEDNIKQYIGTSVAELMKYNDMYIYLPDTYMVTIEEYVRKPLANIQRMIVKKPHLDFFTNNKVNLYMFELLYIGHNFGSYGIINGDAHLNNVCVDYAYNAKNIPQSEERYICFEMVEGSRDSWVVFKTDSTHITYIDYSRGIINDHHLEEICKGMSMIEIAYFKQLERNKMIRYYRYNLSEFYEQHKTLIDDTINNRYNEFFYIYGYVDTYSVINKFVNYLRSLKLDIDQSLIDLMSSIRDDVYEYITTQFIAHITTGHAETSNFIHLCVDKYFKSFNFSILEANTKMYDKHRIYPLYDIFGLKSTIKDEAAARKQMDILRLEPRPAYVPVILHPYNYLCVKKLLYDHYRETQDRDKLADIIRKYVRYVIP